MSTLKVNNLQVGQDATATNNFTLYQPAVPDGTVRLGVGNSGSVGDLLTVNGTAAKLQINTSTGTTGLKIVGLDTNGYSDLDINSVGTIGYSRLFFSDTAGQSGSIIYAHGTNSLQFKTGGSVSATLGGDGLIVGDFTPIDTRNAGGVQVAHSKGISFRSNTSQSVSRNWRIRNDDWGWGNLDFGVGDSVSDVSDSASDTVLSLTSSRNVGIGLTNPSYKLDVNGDIRAYSGTSRPHIYMNFDTTPAAGAAHGRLTVYKSNQNSYSGKVHVQPQYYNGSSYDYLENALVVDAYGHVGINTANPGYALDVVGDHASNAVAVFRQSNASNEGYITIDSPSDSSIRPSYIRLATGTVTQWSFGLKYADALRSFHIGTGAGLGNQKFTVTPTGNVGIGVTNPDVKLHVNGANGYPASSGTTPTGFISIRAKADGATHGMHIGVADAAPYGSWLQCQDANNLAVNYPLILNPNGGNVGIGTTNPQSKLDVAGSITVYGATGGYNSITDNAYLRFGTLNSTGSTFLGYAVRSKTVSEGAGTNELVSTTSTGLGRAAIIVGSLGGGVSGTFQVWTGPGESGVADGGTLANFQQRLTVNDSGNVGIGTTNPGVKLDVIGSIRMSDTPGTNTNTELDVLFQTADGTIDGGSGLRYNPGGDYLKVEGGGGSTIYGQTILLTSGSGPYLIAAANYSSTVNIKVSDHIEFNGNVGIGTTNPSAKLHVNSQRIKVNGVTEIYEAFYLNNNTEYNFDFAVFDEGGAGNSFFIIAGYNHFYNAAYGAHRVAFVSSRGTSLDVVLNIGDQNHPQAGAWTFSKPNSTTLRITKSAGTYGGAGYGFIKVTANLL